MRSLTRTAQMKLWYTLKTHESHMVDYSRHLLSYQFIYCKCAIPTPQSQEPCYYRIPGSFHCRYCRLGDLGVTPLCWPIAVALASFRAYGRVSHSLCSSPRSTAGPPTPIKTLSTHSRS